MAKVSWKPGTMLFPVPPVMVTCGTPDKPNVFTAAWTGIINSEPPMTYISVRPSRYSHHLIEETKEFVINIANLPLAKACDFCGVRSGKTTDKFKEMELEIEPCSKVNVPQLKAAPVSLECKVFEVKRFGTHDMFMAEIVNVNIDDRYIEEDGRLAIEKAGLLAFAHGRYYTLGRDLGAFGFSVDKTKENKTKPRKSKFMEILKIEEQIKDGTLKIKEKPHTPRRGSFGRKPFDTRIGKPFRNSKGTKGFDGKKGKTWFRKETPKNAPSAVKKGSV